MKDKIHKALEELILEKGIANITLAQLSKRSGVPMGSISYHLGTSFTDYVASLNVSQVGPITHGRAPAKFRRHQLLQAAVDIAAAGSYMGLTQKAVAAAAGVHQSTLRHYFQTMGELRNEVMRYACQTGNASIVAQGLAANDRFATYAPRALKDEAARLIASR